MNETVGGGASIRVEEERKEFEAEELPPEAPPPTPEAPPRLPPETAKAIVKVTAAAIGDVASIFTRVEEAKFDEGELDTLAEVWAPFMPTLPPIWVAALTTIIIFSKKTTIVVLEMRRRRGAPKEARKPSEAGKAEAGIRAEEPGSQSPKATY